MTESKGKLKLKKEEKQCWRKMKEWKKRRNEAGRRGTVEKLNCAKGEKEDRSKNKEKDVKRNEE